jgi:hypothetical protein
MAEPPKTDAQRAGLTDEQWAALSEDQRVGFRKQFQSQGQAAPSAQPASIPVQPVKPVEHTDAQRASMSEDQWKGLSEDQRDAHRRRFADPVYRTDAQRAGLTRSQWDALPAAEQNRLREMYPDMTPVPVTTPSPPDPYAPVGLGGRSPAWEQTYVPPPKTEEERIADAKRDPNLPNPADDLRHLPNAPGGRNNPSMTNFDPSRPPTE